MDACQVWVWTPFKGSYLFIQTQKTLPSFLSTGWFQERIQAWITKAECLLSFSKPSKLSTKVSLGEILTGLDCGCFFSPVDFESGTGCWTGFEDLKQVIRPTLDSFQCGHDSKRFLGTIEYYTRKIAFTFTPQVIALLPFFFNHHWR